MSQNDKIESQDDSSLKSHKKRHRKLEIPQDILDDYRPKEGKIQKIKSKTRNLIMSAVNFYNNTI